MSPTVSMGESTRIADLEAMIGRERLARSALARILAPLLVALGWTGAPSRLLASLPPPDVDIDAARLGPLLVDLGFRVRECRWRDWLGGLDTLPVGSIVMSNGAPRLYLGRGDDGEQWYGGTASVAAGDLVLAIDPDPAFVAPEAPQSGWLGRLLATHWRKIAGTAAVGFFADALTLTISLFTMFVYNVVIPTGDREPLLAVAAAALFAVAGAWGLRLARATLTARLAGSAGASIGDAAMRRTLALPFETSGRLGAENNLVRLRGLESARQWFGGAGIGVDVPFVLVVLFVIALIGGWIAIVPAVGLFAYAALAWPLTGFLNARSAFAGRTSRILGETTAVLAGRVRELRGIPGSALWRARIVALVARSVAANRDFALANALVQTVGNGVSLTIVLATMATGIGLVLSGGMSTGGLIATMMLIWRVTMPAQRLFASQVRFKQLIDSSRQIDRLLATPGESADPRAVSPLAGLPPAIAADRLYYRYAADREPALGGVSFKVEPGRLIAIIGPNGAGKTTLIELLAGLRPAHNGAVRISGRDIRQIDPLDYRAWHGYLPQRLPALPLSVRDLLRLRRPGADDARLEAALRLAAGEAWWRFVGAKDATEGLALTIPPAREDRAATRARFVVAFAAAILDEPPLVLLDDPLSDRDPALDAHLLCALDALRGRCTVVLATHRPELIRRADLVAVLDGGALAHFGPVAAPQPVTAAD